MLKKSRLLGCATALTALLMGCGGSKLPTPTPLTPITSSVTAQKIWASAATTGNDDLLFPLAPVTDNGVLYTAGHTGDVTALTLTNGKKIWQRHYPQLPFSSNLALTGNFLYLGTDNAEVVKLDKTTGQLLWKKSVPSTVIAAPSATSDNVFAKTINGEITALSTPDGRPHWNYQQTAPALILRDTSNVLLHDNLLLAGFANGTLTAFDHRNGDILWNKQISLSAGKTDVERMNDVAASPKIGQGILYAATYQGQLIAFTLAHPQDNLWQVDASLYNDFTLSPAAIFYGDSTGNLLALDKKTGATLWQQTALSYRHLTAPLYIEHNLLAVGDQEGYLHFLSASDGHLVGRIHVDRSGMITAPIWRDGLLILQTNAGKIYAYKIVDAQP